MTDPKYEIARASIVEAPERDAEQFSDEDDPIYLHNPALLKRIGAQGIILLSLGTLCLLAVLGLLSYFWFGGPYSGYVWRRVVLSDWAPRVASLLAEMARIILSLQAILATSMIASVALESGTVALSKAPAVLIMRFANTGPLMLARNLLAGTIRRKKRSKGMREDAAIWMILPVVGTFVVSQFLSPLVVSDFESDLVVGERGEVNVSEGLQMVNGARNYMNKKDLPWQSKPLAYPVMAGEFDDANGQLTGGVDTGKSVYALLPFGSVDDRERIQSFEGEAIVMDAQVVCVSPTLVEGTVSQGNGRDFDGFDTIELNGVLMPGTSGIDKYHIPATGLRITCLAALPDDEDNTPTKQIPLSLCSLSTVNGPSDRKEYWRYLVLRTNGTRADWFSQIRGAGSSGWTSTTSTSVSNPWTILHTTSAATFLSLSLCTSPFSFNISHITASTSYPLKEPTIGWNTTTDNHLVTDVATNFRRRSNLLALTSRSQASKPINPPEDLVVASFGANVDYAKNPPNNTFVMCTYCYDSPSPGLDSKMKWMHPAHVELAQRLVDNPAIMLQAHFVTLCQSVYYERLSAIRTRRATVVPWVRVSRPIKRGGFAAVATVIAVQIFLLVIVVTVFSKTAKGSRLESSWAVGQIWDMRRGRETGLEGWLKRAKSGWSDRELENWDAENDKNTRSEAVELQKQVDGWVVAKR